MTGSRRKPTSQSEHDRMVKKLARDYKARGYDVEADLAGYETPPPVGGYRPDIRAKKGSHETIVEVETPETVNTAHAGAQESAFIRAARRSPTRHFVKKVTD